MVEWNYKAQKLLMVESSHSQKLRSNVNTKVQVQICSLKMLTKNILLLGILWQWTKDTTILTLSTNLQYQLASVIQSST